MPITYKWSLLCDDVRQEANGKWIVIGLYTPDITVPQIPIALPLTLLVCLESDVPGNFTFKIRVNHLETGRPLAEAMGQMGIQKPGMGAFPVRIGVQFQSPGPYTFTFELTDNPREPVFIHPFSVLLNIPQQQMQMPLR